MFTGRQRVIYAFEHKKADRLPVFDVINNPKMYKLFLNQEFDVILGRPSVQVAKAMGLDAVSVPCRDHTCLRPPKDEYLTADTFSDRFGIISRATESSWPLGMAINPREVTQELVDIVRSAKITDDDVREVREAVEEANGEIAVFAGLRSAFGFLFIMLGLENMAEAIYEEPELLQELIDASNDYWTEMGLKLIEAGCDALYLANDLGMNERTLISPAHLRQFFFPGLRKQIETWKKAGGRILYHSCGNVNAVLEDLADMGIDALTNIQIKAGMNLADAKARIGDRVTIVGNVDATGILCQSDKTLIDNAIREVVETAGQDGGLVIATDHSFHEGIPVENVFYFIEKAKELGTF